MIQSARASAPHLVLGLCVMALGVTLVLDRAGVLRAADILRFWPVILVLFGASIVVQALRPASDGVRSAGLPIGPIFLLVVVAFLYNHGAFWRFAERRISASGNNVSAVLSGSQRTISGRTFNAADVTAVMGGAKLDIRGAALEPGQSAVIDVLALMGGAELLVPKEWNVSIETTSVMGGVTDARRAPPAGRRGRGFGRNDRPALPPPPPSPDASAPEPAAPRDESLERPDDGRRPDETATTTAAITPTADPNAPRVIVRGLVMMGGLVIKSQD